MAKRRKAQVRRPNGNRLRKAMSVILSILVPPVGIVMVWRSRWSNTARCALTALALGCALLMVSLLPSADSRIMGGIEMVGSAPQAEIYGPELPAAMVEGYVARSTESILYEEEEETQVEYVYATPGRETYHTKKCKYRTASSQRMTPYEAYYLGYRPCKTCNPPVYTPRETPAQAPIQ